jgi:hypothetical protein
MSNPVLSVVVTEETATSWVAPDPARLAKQLHETASVWSKTLLLCLGREDPSLVWVLYGEILAFGVVLTELQLHRQRCQDAQRFSKALGDHLARLCRRTRGALRLRRLLVGSSRPRASSDPVLESFDLVKAGRTYREFHVTEEMFADFCSVTGLAKEALVGHGSNLVSILFYMVIHGRAYSEGNASRQQLNRVLKSARECRASLEESIRNAFHPPQGETRQLGLPNSKSGLVAKSYLLRNVLQA